MIFINNLINKKKSYSDQENSHSRYERKFSVASLTPAELDLIVRLHPSCFSGIYYQRRVNSIYLDNRDLESSLENLYGVSNRAKVRVRWYGDITDKILSPNLEIKLKTGAVGRKIVLPINDFNLAHSLVDVLKETFNASNIPEPYKIRLELLEPSVLVSYLRKYYVSADQKYRLTLDTAMEFYKCSPKNFVTSEGKSDNSIIELKYSVEEGANAHEVTSKFPFRVTKSSKYVSGVQALLGV